MEERICRVCLMSEQSVQFTRIFGDNLALKIFLVSSVKIIESHIMPALICKSCEIEAYQAFNFRKKIQTSQEYFNRKLINFIDDYLEQNINDESSKIVIQEELDDLIDDSETIEEYLDYTEVSELPSIIEEPEITKIEESPSKKLSCQICGLTLSRRQKLIQHERLHFLDTTSKYSCDKCGKKFNQRFGLVPHFQKYHNYHPGKYKEKWKCAICIDKILPPGNLEVHYRKIHNEFYSENKNGLKPKINSLKKEKKRKLSAKKAAHVTDKRPKVFFPCEICGNSFTKFTRYQKHLNELHGVREHDILQTDNIDSLDLSSSMSDIKSQKQNSIPCSTCGKMFVNLNTCKTHEKIHSGLRYICDLCGSSFSMKSYLTSHVQKVHLKLKRFKCNMCTKSFVHRELLNYHIKKHLNIRNYSCQFCQKTFVRKACVTIHERIHKNERPYSCKYCNRQFIHHSECRRHEYRHRNDLSYV